MKKKIIFSITMIFLLLSQNLFSKNLNINGLKLGMTVNEAAKVAVHICDEYVTKANYHNGVFVDHNGFCLKKKRTFNF